MQKLNLILTSSIRRPAALVLLTLLAACSTTSYEPRSIHPGTVLPGVQSHTVEDVTVSITILTDDQALQHFGVDLAQQGVQALRMTVHNPTPHKFWFIRNLVNPDFFSSDEVALLVRSEVPDNQFEQMRQYLRDESIRILMQPMMETGGYIFLPYVEGGRYIDIRLTWDTYDAGIGTQLPPVETEPQLVGQYAELRFGFALTLPDGLFDYELLDTAQTYGDQELPDYDTAGLRERLEQLPCCAMDKDSKNNGDPINVVLVGNSLDVLNSLSRSGWSFTHRITPGSIARMVSAALDGEGYAVAPVSSLYLFDRKQDFALQRARVSLAQRNHTRFWLAPFTYEGRQVWVGQVSRDIGIKLTTKSPSLTTHIVDPEVDLTREYLLHSLLAQGLVRQFGFVKGSTVASREDPSFNLTGDPYFSDGMRLVVMLSPYPLSYEEISNLRWERSLAPIAEGQSEAAERYVQPIKPADTELP